MHEEMSAKCRPGPRFTNGFSIAIQIRWKFRITLISILIQLSLQNFVHGTTAVLSWHVQKFVAIWWPATELWQGEVSIEFELRAKKTLVKQAPVCPGFDVCVSIRSTACQIYYRGCQIQLVAHIIRVFQWANREELYHTKQIGDSRFIL